MSDLCCRALQAGLEIDFTRRMIISHRLLPPESAASSDSWPWPLAIYTLGRFEAVIDGRPVDFSGKRKLQELLKALVALGGSAVREERITDLLWPDAEGDDAHNSFKMTLSRLRRLLPDDVIRFQDGAFSLNRRLVWWDVWAFDRLYETCSDLWAKSRQPGIKSREAKHVIARAIAQTEMTLARYGGYFLPDDTGQAWTVSQRERLRTRLLRLTVISGQYHEEKGKWNAAAEIYRRGLEADKLQEELYQRLMGCCLKLGRRTEALAVYDRCRAELAAQLKIKPSTETEALFAELRE
jgi:two-component SAPR family response regulator